LNEVLPSSSLRHRKKYLEVLVAGKRAREDSKMRQSSFDD